MSGPKPHAHDSRLSPIGVALLLGAALIAFFWYLQLTWSVDDQGLSHYSGKVPYWDFSNFWGGARLSITGHVDALFDVQRYRDLMTELLGAPAYHQEWSYPPSMLVLGAPFALLPIGAAYALWTVVSVALMGLSLATLPISRTALILAIVSPAVALNAAFGQNGALMAALLIGGLSLCDRRPVLSGILIGLMCIKPHLAMLTPFALLASGNWRAVVSAAVTVVVVVGLSIGAFGLDAWAQFLAETRPMMVDILEAPYRQSYQIHGISVFLLARAFGADVTMAYAAQIISAAIAVLLTIRLWWRPAGARQLRIVTTVLLTVLATPYEWSYDLALLAGPLAWLIVERPQARSLAIVAWIWPGISLFVTALTNWPLAPVVLWAIAAVCVRMALSEALASTSRSKSGAPVPASTA